MSKKNISDIEKKVMSQIQAGQIKMRPKLYFSFLGVLSILAVLLFGFVSSYFMGIVSLWLRIETSEGLARGARRNLASLIEAFPWWSLILGLISIVALVYFVRKIGNFYKLKLSYLIIAVVVISLAFGLMFSYSSFTDTFRGRNNPATSNSWFNGGYINNISK